MQNQVSDNSCQGTGLHYQSQHHHCVLRACVVVVALCMMELRYKYLVKWSSWLTMPNKLKSTSQKFESVIGRIKNRHEK